MHSIRVVVTAASCAMTLFAAQTTVAKETLTISGGEIAVPAAGPDGVISFKGIPYAHPPIGTMRWRAPDPVLPWQGVRPTESFSADCMQRPSEASPAERPRSEDCLYLNVWSTASSGAGNLPVFVWIHGGGSRVGSGAQPRLDGSPLAKKGIVVVTINYRLGPFGFLSTRDLSAESGYGASGNYGFLDQIAALRWVRQNIAQFGGDPDRVTVGGQSSGSVSVGALMASPLATGLFHQAIGESGSIFRVAELGSMGATDLKSEEAKGERIVSALKARDLADLRAKPADAILTAAEGTGTYYNLPVVDGHVLPRAPWTVSERKSQNDVPLLIGWNADEGSLQRMGAIAPLPEMLSRYYGTDAGKIARYYPAAKPGDLYQSTIAAGDNSIGYPTWKWAVAQLRFGKSPVYLYEFNHAPKVPAGTFGPTFDVKNAGAFHGAEVPYVFNTLNSKSTWTVNEQDRRIASMMSGYWANFIKTGNPNGRDLPQWSRYNLDQPRRMEIGPQTGSIKDPDFAKFEAMLAVHQRVDPPLPTRP